MKYLLQEDDRAPDAGEWFEKRLKEEYNLTVRDFTSNGENVSSADGYTIKYILGDYSLECSACDPYWKLGEVEKKVIKEDLIVKGEPDYFNYDNGAKLNANFLKPNTMIGGCLCCEGTGLCEGEPCLTCNGRGGFIRFFYCLKLKK